MLYINKKEDSSKPEVILFSFLKIILQKQPQPPRHLLRSYREEARQPRQEARREVREAGQRWLLGLPRPLRPPTRWQGHLRRDQAAEGWHI